MSHFSNPLPLIADAGLPMIVLTWPWMVILLIPVIAIEGLLFRKWLGLKTWQALKTNAVSNLFSTLIGIPLAWAVMVVVELGGFRFALRFIEAREWNSPLARVIFVVLSSAWLAPLDGKQYLWAIPLAILVLLIPFFFASYWIEYVVVRKMLGGRETVSPEITHPQIRTAVRNANLVTYGLMFLATSVYLAIGLRHR